MSQYNFTTHTFKLPADNNTKTETTVIADIRNPNVIQLHQWYERACTAEYLIEHEEYGPKLEHNEDIAYKVACDVRDRMDKYDIVESDAIKIIFNKFDIEKYR